MKKRILIPILVCVFVASLLCACSKDINFTFPKYNVNKTPTKEDPLVKDEGAVVDGVLIPALDAVGAAYEAGTLFLPQLLQAASAAQSAFSISSMV